MNPVPLRAAVDALPAYVPGSRPAAGEELWRLSSNENPFSPLPTVLKAIKHAAREVNRYPEMRATEVRAAYSEYAEVAPEQVVVGNGSVAVLAHVLSATVAPGDEVIYAWRSFEAYPIAVAIAGGVGVPVPITRDGRHNLSAMAAAISPRTKAVLVCSPNNPTGPTVAPEELAAFLGEVPPNVLVLLDEAYHEFTAQGRQSGTCPALTYLSRHPNLVVLRTLSKAFGLAGLRVGFALGDEYLIAGTAAVATPFGVSVVGQAAALAALEGEAITAARERVAVLVAERERVAAQLHAQGWALPHSEGNFLWFGFGKATQHRAKQARDAGILVRPFADEGLRVSIGEPRANDDLLALAARWRRVDHSP